MSIFKTRYRIVRDEYCGFEAQRWVWWFPFWSQWPYVNTHYTVERAEEHIRRYSRHFVKEVIP